MCPITRAICPHDTPTGKVVFWTYLGAAGSALWLMALGAFLASALPVPDAIGSVREVGNHFYPGFGTLTVLIAVPSLIGIMAINCYGAMLTSLSAIDGFRKVTPSLKVRVAGILIISTAVFLITLSIPSSYLSSFNTFVLLMLYLLVPWTAVNLVDFYGVRKGRYAISEIFNPSGIYGLWNKAGLVAYCTALIAMVPFMSLEFYQGPAVQALGGADVAFFIGLLVASTVYWIMTRTLDSTLETPFIDHSDRLLEEQLQ